MSKSYGYSSKVMDIFRNPRNMGDMDNPDAVGKVGNPGCGDLMWMFLRIGKEDGKEIIRDVRVKTFGCVAAIATSSVLTEMIKGRSLQDAMKISKQDIVDVLEGLPDVKVHCSILAIDALKEAVYDYHKRNNIPIPEELGELHKRVEVINRGIEHSH